MSPIRIALLAGGLLVGFAGSPRTYSQDDVAAGEEVSVDPQVAVEITEQELQELLSKPEVKAIFADFEAKKAELAESLADLREVHLRYSNELDQSETEKQKYREIRDRSRNLMNELLRIANEALSFGYTEAGAFALKMMQTAEENSIYNDDTYEASAKLLDANLQYKFLFQVGLRSSIITGHFDTARAIADILTKEENLDDVDYGMIGAMDQLEQMFEVEKDRITADETANLPRVRFRTTNGDFVVELFLNEAPSTVANFLKLVRNGFYEDAEYFQVVDDLLALCGHPTNAQAVPFLKDEIDPATARKGWTGSLMMASLPTDEGRFVENSASTQFSILLVPMPVASSQQTVFGRVIEGMDVVCTFQRVDPSKEKKKAEIKVPPDRILEIEIIRAPETLPDSIYVFRPGPVPLDAVIPSAQDAP